MASGSGWILWVWLAGGGCGWILWVEVYRFPLLFIPTPLVSAHFCLLFVHLKKCFSLFQYFFL